MAAESASAAVILLSSHFGYSLSTTHVATGSILGVGVGKKGAEVRWSVAGRMATAWVFTLPSAGLVGAQHMPLPSYLNSVLKWLRAGYPEGLPATDYIPLFALLGTQLTDEDLHAIADQLASESDPQSAAAIKKAITDVTSVTPNDADVARVRARPAAGGWRLARPNGTS